MSFSLKEGREETWSLRLHSYQSPSLLLTFVQPYLLWRRLQYLSSLWGTQLDCISHPCAIYARPCDWFLPMWLLPQRRSMSPACPGVSPTRSPPFLVHLMNGENSVRATDWQEPGSLNDCMEQSFPLTMLHWNVTWRKFYCVKFHCFSNQAFPY